MICLSYLRFSTHPRIKPHGVRKAQSPLQPFLALWGFGWSVIIGLPLTIRSADTLLVFTTGFKVFTRHNEFWSTTDEYWGFSLASFAVIAAFLLLVLGSYFVIGKAFIKPDAEDASALRGVSPILPKRYEKNFKIREIASAVLDSI
jgi:hypothetical protein